MRNTKNLSRPYTVRLPLDKAKQFEDIADKSGLGISGVLREALIKSRPVFRGRVPITLQKDRAMALRYMYKSSNNINQIAKILNTLNIKGELDYKSSIKYLYLLDTIEAHLNIIVDKLNAN